MNPKIMLQTGGPRPVSVARPSLRVRRIELTAPAATINGEREP